MLVDEKIEVINIEVQIKSIIISYLQFREVFVKESLSLQKIVLASY